MAKVMATILIVYGFTLVVCLPSKRSPWKHIDFSHERQLPRRLQDFDANQDDKLDRDELTKYFGETLGFDHLTQNVGETFHLLDWNQDGFITAHEAEPLPTLM